MTKSLVDLKNPESITVDPTGRSIAYFCKNSFVSVDKSLIEDLKINFLEEQKKGGKNIRLCLHNSAESEFHQMIILEQKGNYYRPHKHSGKGESQLIIEGKMGVFIFNDTGEVKEASVLEPSKTFLCRISNNIWHAIMPLTDLIIYHEARPGPFVMKEDSIYPNWAPNGDNLLEINEYTKKLQSYLK